MPEANATTATTAADATTANATTTTANATTTNATTATAADAGPEPVEYESTGNAGLDLGLKFIGKLGFGPEHAAVQASGNGDFSKLEAELEKLGDKAAGWKDVIAVAKAAYAQVSAERKAANEKTLAKINTVTGGEWEGAKEWASAKAEPAEKEAINAALAAGGMQAVAMAQYLTNLYRQSEQYTKQGKSAVKPDATGGASNSDALSPVEYAKEVRALAAKGKVYEGSPEYKALQVRRQAWRG